MHTLSFPEELGPVLVKLSESRSLKQESPFKKNIKISLEGLAGFGLGTLVGVAGAHAADKAFGAATRTRGIPTPYLALAAPVIGGAAGLAYSVHQAKKLEEMRRAVEDRSTSPHRAARK
jgi:hypothetical protein